MSRAPTPCQISGCPNPATADGRCPQHARPDRWANGAHGYREVGWTRQQTKARIFARDGDRCYRCGAAATTIDHVVPISQGGANDDTNRRGICTACHRVKTQAEARAGRAPAAAGRRRRGARVA